VLRKAVLEVQAAKRMLSPSPVPRWYPVRHHELKRREKDLEPAVLHLERVEDFVVGGPLAAIHPMRGKPVIAPLIGSLPVLVATQIVVHRAHGLVHA
jgi:hypothetical protein